MGAGGARGTTSSWTSWLEAIRTRDPRKLTADILEGHISSSLCHTGLISHRLGERLPLGRIRQQVRDDPLLAERFDSFCDHLARNGMDLEKQEATLGARLALDPQAERFLRQRRGQCPFDACGPPAICRLIVNQPFRRRADENQLCFSSGGSVVFHRRPDRFCSRWSEQPRNRRDPAQVEVTTYPFPAELPSSDTYRVTAGGQPVRVIRSERADIAWFACDGPVDIAVEVGHDVKRVDVRPLRHGIRPDDPGPDAAIPHSRPRQAEHRDQRRHPPAFVPLCRRAGAGRSQTGSAGVRRFAGGKIHESRRTDVGLRREHLSRTGRRRARHHHGQVGEERPRLRARHLRRHLAHEEEDVSSTLPRCEDARLDDFLVLGSYGWTLVPWQCQGVRIENVKLVGWRDNDDGIDVCASRNVRVEDCFLRTKDDCITLKAYGDRSGASDVRDVRVSRTVFWNAEWGNAMEIGYELRTARVSDVVVEDCDIIRVEGGAVLSIHNADFATVEDIRYEDIRVEDASDKLLELHVGLSIYSQDCPKPYNRSNPQRKPVPGGGPWLPLDLLTDEERTAQDANRGRIRNVVFRNIDLVGDKMPVSFIHGSDALRPVENVTFEQVRFHDQVVRDEAALKLSVTNGAGVRIAE